MLEMADTVSSGVLERLSEVSSDDGSVRGSGSREKLLASPEVSIEKKLALCMESHL